MILLAVPGHQLYNWLYGIRRKVKLCKAIELYIEKRIEIKTNKRQ